MRVTFLFDGFNLYHSINSIRKPGHKWLNLDHLCRNHLHVLGAHVGKRVELESIHYFSAYANHLAQAKPDKLRRHKAYISCLESVGVNIHLGRFKKKDIFCTNCRTKHRSHEEKETDVAIAIQAFYQLHSDSADIVALVTGDSDMVPAVKMLKQEFPSKHVCIFFPHHEGSKELKKHVRTFHFNAGAFSRSQFPNQVAVKKGKIVSKPPSW